MDKTQIDFDSHEELAEILENIGFAIHAKNRIYGGESNFLWLLAETIRKTGRLALLSQRSNEYDGLYGAAFVEGSIPENLRETAFLKLLEEQETERQDTERRDRR